MISRLMEERQPGRNLLHISPLTNIMIAFNFYIILLLLIQSVFSSRKFPGTISGTEHNFDKNHPRKKVWQHFDQIMNKPPNKISYETYIPKHGLRGPQINLDYTGSKKK